MTKPSAKVREDRLRRERRAGGARSALRASRQRLRQRRSQDGRRHRGARRRRADAADAAPAHERRHADLRHEPRLGRLPHERLSARTTCATGSRAPRSTSSIRWPCAPSTRTASVHEALAINEVSLFRQTYQAAKLRISIDGTVRLDELICDGVLVATPAGSTAYNLSALRADPADQRAAAGADADQRRSGRGAGAARCCPTRPRSRSRCWSRTSARSAPSPTTPRRAR